MTDNELLAAAKNYLDITWQDESTDSTSLFIDKMAAAAQYSNTDVDQLGESILQVGGTARVLSGGITELDTALGILANSGIKAAEGGTHLRNILLALTAPTDKAKDALDALGIATMDQDGNLRALDDIFADLKQSMSGLTEAHQQSTIGEIFNVTDLAAVQALMQGVGDSWDDLEEKINNAEGAAQKMADTMQDNLAGDMEELSSAAESLGISFYDTFNNNLRGLVQDVTESVNKLGAAMEEGGIKGFVAELGTQAAQWSVVISDVVPDAVDAAFDLVEAVGDAIVDNADQIVGAVERTAGVLVSRVAELLPVLIPGIVQLIQSLCTYIADHVDDVIQVALVIVQALVTGLINAIPILLEAIPEIITALCDGIMDSLDTLEEEGNSLIDSLVAGIVEAIPLLIEAVPQVIEALVSAITGTVVDTMVPSDGIVQLSTEHVIFADGLSVGNVYEGGAEITLDGVGIPAGADINIDMRLVAGATVSDWIPWGRYRLYDKSTTTDGLVYAAINDRIQETEIDIMEAFPSQTYPVAMSTMLAQICDYLGIDMDACSVVSSDMLIQEPGHISMRQVMGYIASAHGGNIYITRDGKLRLLPLKPASSTPVQNVANAVVSYLDQNTPVEIALAHYVRTVQKVPW